MRISDWSSDVCSSDLRTLANRHRYQRIAPIRTDRRPVGLREVVCGAGDTPQPTAGLDVPEIGNRPTLRRTLLTFRSAGGATVMLADHPARAYGVRDHYCLQVRCSRNIPRAFASGVVTLFEGQLSQ